MFVLHPTAEERLRRFGSPIFKLLADHLAFRSKVTWFEDSDNPAGPLPAPRPAQVATPDPKQPQEPSMEQDQFSDSTITPVSEEKGVQGPPQSSTEVTRNKQGVRQSVNAIFTQKNLIVALHVELIIGQAFLGYILILQVILVLLVGIVLLGFLMILRVAIIMLAFRGNA